MVFSLLCGLDWLSRLCFGLGYVVLSWSWVCLGWFWLGACLVSVGFVVNFVFLSRLVWLYHLVFWFESFFFSCGFLYFLSLLLFFLWCLRWLADCVVGLAVVGLWSVFGWGNLVVQCFYLVRVVIKGSHCA